MEKENTGIEKYLFVHKVVSRENGLFSKYFSERNIFHDCNIENIEYNPYSAELGIQINSDLFLTNKKPTEKPISIIQFSRILDVTFTNYPWNLVDKESLDKCEWNDFLLKDKNGVNTNFLYCLFDKSEHEKFVSEKMNKKIYKARVFFDNWIQIALSFIDLQIILPDNITEKEFFESYDKYWKE